jgi:hypothetical protein
MKNIFTFLFFVFTTNSVFAQANVFKITASADVPTTLLVKRPDLVAQTIDTINIENSDLKKNISIDQPQAAILETDQQQVMIWMIPGYSLHVKLKTTS